MNKQTIKQPNQRNKQTNKPIKLFYFAGNELIQYQPPEELPNLFDFGDSVYDGDLSQFSNVTDFMSDSLLTPDHPPVSPSSIRQKVQVKTEEVD